MDLAEAIRQTERWFDANGWTVFDFQREAWQAWHNGESGLIHSPTGSGKTLAAWLGAVQAAMVAASEDESEQKSKHESTEECTKESNTDRHQDTGAKDGAADTAVRTLKVLWITPLRALANDTRTHLEAAANALGAPVTVELRTGDTSSSRRSRQRADPPFALVTTPESLSVMLSYPGSEIGLAGVDTIIVDEWHELLGSKRGVQLQLCLARMKRLNKNLRIWGVSATLDNLDEALHVLLGHTGQGRLVRGIVPRAVEVYSVLPQDDVRFRWSGHLGLQLVNPVVEAIEQFGTTLLFTNTR